MVRWPRVVAQGQYVHIVTAKSMVQCMLLLLHQPTALLPCGAVQRARALCCPPAVEHAVPDGALSVPVPHFVTSALPQPSVNRCHGPAGHGTTCGAHRRRLRRRNYAARRASTHVHLELGQRHAVGAQLVEAQLLQKAINYITHQLPRTTARWVVRLMWRHRL